jgi:hypothetical protein
LGPPALRVALLRAGSVAMIVCTTMLHTCGSQNAKQFQAALCVASHVCTMRTRCTCCGTTMQPACGVLSSCIMLRDMYTNLAYAAHAVAACRYGMEAAITRTYNTQHTCCQTTSQRKMALLLH